MIIDNKFNLSENSISYHEQSDIYKLFSIAEDYPDHIFSSIQNDFKNKIVLDLGCGNGKYSKKIIHQSQLLFSVDKSIEQLSYLPILSSQHFIVQADAQQLPFQKQFFDVVFCSWMLGTVLDINKQKQIINDIKRVLKPQGKILFVENNAGGEFEILRGRNPNIDHRTQNYNEFLLEQGFKEKHTINTYFQFDNPSQAQDVFYSIWKERLTKIITKSTIEHKVIVFEYIKN